MKTVQALVLSTFSVLISGVSFAECPQMPIGGSEHSFGVPGPIVGEALDAFESSNEVQAQVKLLERHGFCPSSERPEIVEMEESCREESSCSYVISMKQDFKRRAARSKSIVAIFSKSSDGRVMVESEPLNLRGIGQEVVLPVGLSQSVFEGLSAAGIIDPRGVMGSMRLTVGQVICSQPVVPNPVPSCILINHDQSLDLDTEPAGGLMKFLLAKRAFVGPRNIVGAVNVGAALLACESGVYPGAKASCTAVVEKPVE
jgi:hypothetical protein